jgi:lysozyme family protein
MDFMAKFDLSIPKLLKWEGGYVNDPLDPGGETNFGITQKAWAVDRLKWIVAPPESVKDLTKKDAEMFYLFSYWTPLSLRLINSQEVADALFSFAVNQGAGRAVKRMQLILGVTQDGKMGKDAIAAINARDGKELCNQYCQLTAIYFNSLVIKRPRLAKFSRGWNNRVDDYRVKI